MGRGGSSGGSRSGGSSRSSRSSGGHSGGGSRASFSSGRSRGYASSSSSRSSGSSNRSSGSSRGHSSFDSSGSGVPPRRTGMGFGPGMGGMGPGYGYGPRKPRRFFGRPAPMMGYGGYGAPHYGGGGGCGCLSSTFVMLFLVLLLVVPLPVSCASGMRGCSSSSQSQSSNGSGQVNLNAQPISTGSTREKLDAALCVESSEWIDDQAGWLSNQSKVVSAMQSFYDQTGVQPYLVIADEIDGTKDYTADEVESYMRSLYDDLYQDDGHLILLFCEPYENEYDPYLLVGKDAQKVVDSTEGENAIYQAIDYWYTDSSLDDDAYFARIFIASANKLMYGTDFSEFK